MSVLKKSEWLTAAKKHGSGNADKAGALFDAYHAAKTSKLKIEKGKALQKELITYSRALNLKDKEQQKLAGYIGTSILPSVEEGIERYEELEDFLKDIGGLTLAKVLKNSKLLKLFTAYAKKEFNAENLDFIEDLNSNRKKEEIYRAYIDPASKTQINLGSPVQRKLEEQAAAGDYNKMDFGPARHEVEQLLTRDTLQRFKVSAEIKKYAEDMTA